MGDESYWNIYSINFSRKGELIFGLLGFCVFPLQFSKSFLLFGWIILLCSKQIPIWVLKESRSVFLTRSEAILHQNITISYQTVKKIISMKISISILLRTILNSIKKNKVTPIRLIEISIFFLNKCRILIYSIMKWYVKFNAEQNNQDNVKNI